MCDGGEEVEYRLVCRRTGEVVGMAYIRPQEEANLHNLLLGPEEELGVVKRESINNQGTSSVETSMAVVESRDKMASMASQVLATTLVPAKALGQVKGANLESAKQPSKGGKGDLGKPGLFGWQREVVYEGHTRSITGIHYLTPPHPDTGLRRRCKNNSQILDFLAISGNSHLNLDNFQLNRKELGLGQDFEVCRKAFTPGPTNSSIYVQFFEEVESPGARNASGLLDRNSRRMACTLCGGTLVRYENISYHMKKLHLPAETCPTCGSEVPAKDLFSHKKRCGTRKPKAVAGI